MCSFASLSSLNVAMIIQVVLLLLRFGFFTATSSSSHSNSVKSPFPSNRLLARNICIVVLRMHMCCVVVLTWISCSWCGPHVVRDVRTVRFSTFRYRFSAKQWMTPSAWGTNVSMLINTYSMYVTYVCTWLLYYTVLQQQDELAPFQWKKSQMEWW